MNLQGNYKKELGEAGLKNTKARNAVLAILAKENRPLDVSEIFSVLEKEHIAIDQATVYRILDIFFDKNLIERFEFQEGKFRYELMGEEHHHLICEKCGSIEDVSDCGLDVLEKEIRRKKGFLVKRHSLEFYGMCTLCQR